MLIMPNVFKPGAKSFSVKLPVTPRRRAPLPWYDLALVWLFLVVVFAAALVTAIWLLRIG